MADADAARPRPGRVPVAPKSSPAAPGLAPYFSTLDPLAEPSYETLQQLSALEQNGVLRNDAFRAAFVVAHIWSSQALAGLAQQGRRSAVARRIFVSTGKWFESATESVSSTTIRTGRALLRVDVLSSYARYLARVGQPDTAEAAGASGGGADGCDAPLTLEPQLRRDEEDAEVVAVITHVLDSLAALASDEPSSQHPQRVQKPAAAGASKAAGNAQPPAPPPPPSLGSELRSGLSRSQVLEHTAAALLRLAAAAPAEAPPPATAPPQQMWVHVTQATWHLCWSLKRLLSKKGWDVSLANWHALAPSGARTPPAAASSSAAADADAAEKAAQAAAVRERAAQVRPLLSGPCLQFFLCWALGCTRLTVEHVAGLGGEPQEVVGAGADAAAEPALQPRLLMRPLQPSLCPVAEDQLEASCQVLAAASLAFQATVGGGGGAGGDGRAAGAATAWPRQQQQQQPQQRACTTPYPPACVYDAVRSVLPGFCVPQLDEKDVDSGSERTDGTLLLVRLIGELPSRAAAARLPGLWRLLLLQLGCGLVEAMQGPLCKAARLLLPNELNARATAAAASGAVLLQPPPGLSYSLRCALDAGLLPTLERMLRDPDAWSAPPDDCGSDGSGDGDVRGSGTDGETRSDGGRVRTNTESRASVGNRSDGGGSDSDSGLSSCGRDAEHRLELLMLLMGVLGTTGVWPALLAHGPVHQLVSLIASLGAVFRNEMVAEVRSANANRLALAFALTALLQQAVDAVEWGAGRGAGGAAGVEPAQQQQLSKGQRRKLCKRRAGGGGAGVGGSSTSSGGSGAGVGVSAGGSGNGARGNGSDGIAGIGDSSGGTTGIDIWLQFCYSQPDTGPVTLPVMAAYGGAPLAGSAAAAQQALLVSLALQQWLPALVRLATVMCTNVCWKAKEKRDENEDEDEDEDEEQEAGVAAGRGGAGEAAQATAARDDDPDHGAFSSLRLCAAVLRLLTRVAMRAAALAQRAAGAAAAGAAAAAGPPCTAAAPAAWVPDPGPGRDLQGWLSGVLDPCAAGLTHITMAMSPPVLAHTAAGSELESALLDVVQAYAVAKPAFAKELINGFQFLLEFTTSTERNTDANGREIKVLKREPEMVRFSDILASAAGRHRRRPLSAFITRVVSSSGQLMLRTVLEVELRAQEAKQLSSELTEMHGQAGLHVWAAASSSSSR